MGFKVIPVLETIKGLYESPRNRDRFDKYLLLLQGPEKKDMILPISAFNPMGKELALEKINELIHLKAEALAGEIIRKLDQSLENSREIGLALNLVDDIDGSWSERYATDYKSKFEFEALLKRNFCTPIFFTSESFSEELINRRTKEYLLRTIYWLKQGKPKTLKDCLAQELAVQKQIKPDETPTKTMDFTDLETYLEVFGDSDDYNIIFNFFYGGEAAESLNYSAEAIEPMAGFEYARLLAHHVNPV